MCFVNPKIKSNAGKSLIYNMRSVSHPYYDYYKCTKFCKFHPNKAINFVNGKCASMLECNCFPSRQMVLLYFSCGSVKKLELLNKLSRTYILQRQIDKLQIYDILSYVYSFLTVTPSLFWREFQILTFSSTTYNETMCLSCVPEFSVRSRITIGVVYLVWNEQC